VSSAVLQINKYYDMSDHKKDDYVNI